MKYYTEIYDLSENHNVYTISEFHKKYDISAACCGFDIETTNDDYTKTAYMYIWQFAVDGVAYYGRTWEQFFEFLGVLRGKFDGQIYILIHNMGFEMSFLLPRLARENLIKRIFARGKYEPLEIITENNFVFRDSAALTNMSLQTLAKNFTKTQKLNGDLNYSKMRNSHTYLTGTELKYCENDVLILSEYMQKLHNDYSKNGDKIPLTSTGIVRRMVKREIKKNYRGIQKQITELYPETVDKYNFTMRYLFRGGYCHAQTAICGDEIHNVISHDLKSAYPAQMAHEKYPMTKFRVIAPENAFKMINAGMAVIMLVEFTEICAKTAHVYESRHKIIFSENAVYENGRLYSAEKITVLITEIDLKLYSMFYNYKSIKIIQAKCALKQNLPEYLLNPLFRVYAQKEKIGALPNRKTDSDIAALYQTTKMKLNSFYGMCVSRLNLTEYNFVNDEWVEIPSKTYESEIKNAILSPYWGIYITAYTRLTVLSAIYACGDNAFYSDTDSVKHRGNNEYFDAYNAKIEKINAEMCEKYKLNFDVFKNLGKFEFECVYDKFKTYGAKRYITQTGKNVECTVAGLPKTTFNELVKKHGADNAFNMFSPNLSFTLSGKNAAQYGGECTAEIDGEKMHEYGFCYIFSVPFKMNVENAFINAIANRKELKQ